MALENDTALRSIYRGAGLREVRWGWTMERSLLEPISKPAAVEGLTFRNFTRPADNERFREAYNNSFIDHFEFHAVPQELWDHQLGRPQTRPELSWVAEPQGAPGTLAGFCICEIEDEEKRKGRPEGWIALLGTVRGWRGIGLGRSLLLRGLHSLKEAGMDTALLGVDSESPTGANRLYESVGFTVRSKEVMLKSPLAELTV
jgi:ribosomal protein S18 acetylase RimI-like enzyme